MSEPQSNLSEKPSSTANKSTHREPDTTNTNGSLNESRKGIAETISESAESAEELSEGSERISEITSAGSENKSQGVRKKKKGQGGSKQYTGNTTDKGFLFEEGNLPPAPECIRLIEEALRRDIRRLERIATQHRGGFFRKPNYPKYNEAIIEIRHKNVLLKRLVNMAIDTVKKLFIDMFRKKIRTEK